MKYRIKFGNGKGDIHNILNMIQQGIDESEQKCWPIRTDNSENQIDFAISVSKLNIFFSAEGIYKLQ